jgi:hypothetical protein
VNHVDETEAILRKTIQDLQQRKPDFSTMGPELQDAVKEQAQHTAENYRHLGALQSLKYIGTRGGNDIISGGAPKRSSHLHHSLGDARLRPRHSVLYRTDLVSMASADLSDSAPPQRNPRRPSRRVILGSWVARINMVIASPEAA